MKVVAVIVCYYPDLTHLRQTCVSLLGSNAAVTLVDNTVSSSLAGNRDFSDCTVIANFENLGIARGQNIGINQAIGLGADVVVFFDQDSRIDPGFLSALLTPLGAGASVAAPAIFDAAEGFEYPSYTVGRYGTRQKVYSTGKAHPYAVDVVTSSGTAATIETFERAGLMAEDLFIDFVDTEWSLRCRKMGIPILVVPTAVMIHSVGSRSIDIGVATLIVHTPIRCYYQLRNAVQLFRKESVPFLFAARELLVITVHKLLLLIFIPNRFGYLKAISGGILDGLRGVTGRKREAGESDTVDRLIRL